MTSHHHVASVVLSELARVLEIVHDRQQALDEALVARNNLISKALTAAVPAETLAAEVGVPLSEIEQIIGRARFRAIRYVSPPDGNIT